MNTMEHGCSLHVESYDYMVYWDGNIITIIIDDELYANDYRTLTVYHYDFTNHCEMSTADILARHGVSDEEFFQRVKAAYDAYYIS